MKTSALLAGTFDPPTLGHINIIKRAAALYDKLYVIVAHNISKSCLFTPEERIEMLSECITEDNVELVIYSGLIVNFARANNVSVMIRGVRALADFSYEFELAMTNKQLYPEIETLFIPTDPKYFMVRSSQIKEMAIYGADISKMVPDTVSKKLKDKLQGKTLS